MRVMDDFRYDQHDPGSHGKMLPGHKLIHGNPEYRSTEQNTDHQNMRGSQSDIQESGP